jgi:hypothetical protein
MGCEIDAVRVPCAAGFAAEAFSVLEFANEPPNPAPCWLDCEATIPGAFGFTPNKPPEPNPVLGCWLLRLLPKRLVVGAGGLF